MTDRILLVNYDYPPTLAGVRRITKMAQYLPDSGFEPIVLSATPPASGALDFESLSDIESRGYRVWRTPSPDFDHLGHLKTAAVLPFKKLRAALDLAASPTSDKSESKQKQSRGKIISSFSSTMRRIFALPDDRVPWLLTAIPMADHLVKSKAIRYVFTSSYPNCTHLVGLYLKQKYNIIWHADFRDGWTQNPYFADYITPVHKRFNEWLELEVAKSADSITGVSTPIVDHLQTLSARDNAFVLPNGFDPKDMENIPTIDFDKFTIAYTGTMFMQRSPDSFFAAVRGLIDCYRGIEENFQIIFRSNMKSEHLEMIRDLNLQNVIHNWGLGTWKESLTLQKSADVLLVLEGENPNGHIMLTQKIFEYLATGKPILAVTPPGALANLLLRSRAGKVIHPENVFRIKETLFELFLGRITFQRDDEFINTFTRQKQATELADILRSNVNGYLR